MTVSSADSSRVRQALISQVLTIYGSMLTIQHCLNRLVETNQNESARKSIRDGLQLKESKYKELRICFSKSNKVFQPIVINDKCVDVVTSAKLTGLAISDDLKWNTHFSNIFN